MINSDKLKSILTAYKQYFPAHWSEEKYKWEAVKHFQQRWDIQAPEFLTMFVEATDKTLNLLANMNYYPRGMIRSFAGADPEAVRSMFIQLYDENENLAERITRFQATAEEIKDKYNDGTWNQHYQSHNAVTTYLWLRYPDKYYIYKYSECLAMARAVDSDFLPKKGASAENVVKAYELYEEITAAMQADRELAELLHQYQHPDCYPDVAGKTMTIDICYFVYKFYSKTVQRKTVQWFPSEYSPQLSVSDWAALLKDRSVFNDRSLEIMKRLLDYGGEATCKQLAVKYGETAGFYNAGSSNLAKRIKKKTDCPVFAQTNEKTRWWPVLYTGCPADADIDGEYIWKLRDELRAALEQADLSAVDLYAQSGEEDGAHAKRYWWLNANPKIWSFSEIAVGEEKNYTLYNQNNNKRRVFQNFLDAKPGDVVVGYESYPVKQIVALGEITRANDGRNLYFKKTESLTVPVDYEVLKHSTELDHMEYFVSPQGSLFRLSRGEYEFIADIIRESNPVLSKEDEPERYTKSDFLDQVYMSEEQFDTLVALLKDKKNLILKGAPGVGKTYAAKRLAYAMMGAKDPSRIELIQFHQNYTYEDFIMGYKPYEEGFKLTNGIFFRFCMNAANHPEQDFFFIIDEINRGNMSKIFGELLMLIECDYRGTKATLAYSGTLFSVPDNLYIIGMMNTADRSLAMIDYALRRRFSFFEMKPGFDSIGFRMYQAGLQNDMFDELIVKITELNRAIVKDDSLGEGFQIGHSYFCGRETCTEGWMKQVVFYDILPMLEEYWFDDSKKVQHWEKEFNGVFNDRG